MIVRLRSRADGADEVVGLADDRETRTLQTTGGRPQGGPNELLNRTGYGKASRLESDFVGEGKIMFKSDFWKNGILTYT
jgi:hypothetical protein